MESTNQRPRVVEVLKFMGIFLSSLLIMGFVFIGQKTVSEMEDELLLAQIDSLEVQVANYQNRENVLANTLFYADSSLKLLKKLSELEDRLISMKRQGLEGDFGLIGLEGEIQSELRGVQAALTQLSRTQYEKGENLPYRNVDLIKGYNEHLFETYNLLLREKQFKRAAVKGKSDNDESDSDDLEEMQRLVELQREQLEKQQIENQFSGQIDRLSLENENCSSKLESAQVNLEATKNTLLELRRTVNKGKEVVATQAPAILTHSRDLINYTNSLDGIVQRIKGIGDRQDKESLEKLIKSYKQLADELESNASQLSRLNAQL